MRKISVLIIFLAVIITGFTMHSKERKFTSKTYSLEVEDGELYGILTLPDVDKPCPVVLIIQGAGATDKDGNNRGKSVKTNCLKMLAEALGNEGIASVRYDKRGVGKSSQVVEREEDLIFSDYIDDAVLWMEKIQSDDRFNKYYIIGHSEGGLVGAAAANRLSLDGFISIAAPGESIHKTLISQLEQNMKKHLEKSMPIIDELRKGNLVPNPPLELDFIFRRSAQPYLISLFQYDPISAIQGVDAPILILQGDNDLQSSVKDAKMLHNATDSKLVIIKDMNHILKKSPWDNSENISTYSKPKLPIHEDLVEELIKFIK
ncbi:alpha/beta hydrolase [Tissierellaceae bacterium HCP3S3_D8]